MLLFQTSLTLDILKVNDKNGELCHVHNVLSQANNLLFIVWIILYIKRKIDLLFLMSVSVICAFRMQCTEYNLRYGHVFPIA